MKLSIFQGKNNKIILLFGWFGCQQRNLESYKKIYQDQGCTTISGIASSFSLFEPTRILLKQSAEQMLNEALQFSNEVQNPEIFIHAFSNGGCFVYEQIFLILNKKKKTKRFNENQISQLRAMIKGTILDSAPSYMSIQSAVLAIQGAFRNNFLIRYSSQFGIIILFIIQFLLRIITFGNLGSRYKTYWNNMMNDNLSQNYLYIYSNSDKVCDHVKIDLLIEHRQQAYKNIKITKLKFQDSGHVQHYLKYKQEYTESVLKFIQQKLD